jgi:hypothetical protein
VSHPLDLKKYPNNIPNNYVIFKGLKMILINYEKKFINQKYYIKMFTTFILKCMKKNKILAKAFHLLSSTWTLFFKLSQTLGPIQVLANSFKNTIIAFEVHANKIFKIMYPKKYYYPHKIIYLLVLLYKNRNILFLFVYILPCFHLKVISQLSRPSKVQSKLISLFFI